MTGLKGLVEDCRCSLPTACPFSCEEQSQAALPSPCVLGRLCSQPLIHRQNRFRFITAEGCDGFSIFFHSWQVRALSVFL